MFSLSLPCLFPGGGQVPSIPTESSEMHSKWGSLITCTPWIPSPVVVERWQVLSTWTKLSFTLPEPCRSSKGNWAWLAGRRGRGNGCWRSQVSNDPSSLLQFPCQVVFQTQFNVSQASSTTPHSSFCQGDLSWIWDLSCWHVSSWESNLWFCLCPLSPQKQSGPLVRGSLSETEQGIKVTLSALSSR